VDVGTVGGAQMGWERDSRKEERSWVGGRGVGGEVGLDNGKGGGKPGNPWGRVQRGKGS